MVTTPWNPIKYAVLNDRHFVNQSLIYHMHILKEKRENDDLHSFTLNTGKGIKSHGER